MDSCSVQPLEESSDESLGGESVRGGSFTPQLREEPPKALAVSVTWSWLDWPTACSLYSIRKDVKGNQREG